MFSRPNVTRFPDVAWDAETGAFLVVSGQVGITARFVGASGPDGDAFEITTDSQAYSPRVTAVGGAFLVCWLVEASTSVLCRRVTQGGSGPAMEAEQVIESGTSKHLESAPSLACSRPASECLVTWVDYPDPSLRARRVDLSGKPLAPELDVSVTTGVFEAFPSVASAPERGEYVVVSTREPGSLKMAINAQRVAVSTGALVGGTSELYASNGLNNYPEVARDSNRDRFLAISWLSETNPDVAGRLFGPDGIPIGDRIAIAASSGFEGGDGIGLAFDSGADSYLAVYQGPETPGVVQEVWASPVSPDGTPGAAFQVTSAAGSKGVYQPRVASDGSGRFLVVTVVDYTRIAGQLVSMPVVVKPDAGTDAGASGGSAGGGGAAGAGQGAGGQSGSAGRGSVTEADEGCGCRAASARGGAWTLLCLVGLGLARLRRSSRRDVDA